MPVCKSSIHRLGIGSFCLVFAFAFEIQALTLGVVFFSWVVGLPIMAVLVALMFRSIQRTGEDPSSGSSIQ